MNNPIDRILKDIRLKQLRKERELIKPTKRLGLNFTLIIKLILQYQGHF